MPEQPCSTAVELLDVRVVMEDEGGKISEQLIQAMQVSDICQQQCINLKKLLTLIKIRYNFCFQNKYISYYLQKGGIFLNCGIDPVNDDIKIRMQEYDKVLIVRAKYVGVSLIHRLMSHDQNSAQTQEKKNHVDEMAEKSKCRRTKERRIGHIINKVIEWRKYYCGSNQQKNGLIKFSLEEAAKQVKISKKSLDDYLFQIKYGYKFGFNFNEHYCDKVGLLRDFVRQRKRIDKNQQKKIKKYKVNQDQEE